MCQGQAESAPGVLNTDLGALNLLIGLVIAVAGFVVQWRFLKEG